MAIAGDLPGDHQYSVRDWEQKAYFSIQVPNNSLCCKGVSEREFRTRGRGGGPVPEAENLFLTSKFWLILAQIGQIKTIQNPLELENV